MIDATLSCLYVVRLMLFVTVLDSVEPSNAIDYAGYNTARKREEVYG